MEIDYRVSIKTLQKCFIITSASSLSFVEESWFGSQLDGFLIYYCLYEKSTENIPVANDYEIIVDLEHKEIHGIVVKLLNKLMQRDCNLYVRVLERPASEGTGAALCMNLLRKLEKNKLIELEILHDGGEIKIKDFLEGPLENVTCFIGPGNTGKTSIISSVSELYEDKKQKIALLDLTMEHKLTNYFSASIRLVDICIESGQFNLQGQYQDDECVNLYIYDYPRRFKQKDRIFLWKSIQSLSKSYDHVLINADKYMVSKFINAFKLFTNIFIVHDCMPNKINTTHDMLLNLHRSGIDTKKTISIIYNKVVKQASNIGKIEENMIFKTNSNGHLVPLIDINCSTLEILHHKRTMIALNNKVITKGNTLNDAAINYLKNINSLYNAIQHITDCEYTDMEVIEFARYHIYNMLYHYVLPKINQILKRLGWKKRVSPKENAV